jgi:hypothetical protein
VRERRPLLWTTILALMGSLACHLVNAQTCKTVTAGSRHGTCSAPHRVCSPVDDDSNVNKGKCQTVGGAGEFECDCIGKATPAITFQGGPIMQRPRVFLVYWLPTGASFDATVPNGIGNYEALLTAFFTDVSPSVYYSVVGQYAGICNGSPCRVQNAPDAVTIGGTFVDTRAYAHANSVAADGTAADPLVDADIRNEIQLLITQFGLISDIDTEFFVYVGTGIQECFNAPASGSECTFFNPANASGNAFCAYHSAFNDTGGHNVVYAFMPVADGLGAGCSAGVATAPNGQIASDREVVVTTHEFFESVSDPLINAWVVNGGTEIGDLCNQQTGTTAADGSNVVLSGAQFVVQRMWSNFTQSCVLGLPSVQLDVATGGDDLRTDSEVAVSLLSSAASPLQSFSLKPPQQAGFESNTTYRQMLGFNGFTGSQVGALSLSLTSHDGFLETDDTWEVQGVLARIYDASGTQVCQFSGSGTPLLRLTGAAPTGDVPAVGCGAPVLPSPRQCTLPQTLCGTGCADLSKDSKNCGSCGTSCGRGPCVQGACQCLAGTSLCCGGDLGCRKPGKCPAQCP